MYLESLANIAKDTIVKKNPFPHLNLSPSDMYACKWGLTDLNPEAEQTLRNAIENRETFDTGWVGCRKEIRAFRIISDGEVVTVQTSAEMDDFDDLIYDATDKELTEEQIRELNAYWYDSDMDTEATSEATIYITTYEDIMKTISILENENEKQLNYWFNTLKTWIDEITSR